MADCEHEYIKKPHPTLPLCDYPVCRHCDEPKYQDDSWLRGDKWTDAEIEKMKANGLTALEINVLPDRVRLYIHDLETNADPAGTIQDLAACRDNCDALAKQYVDMKSYADCLEILLEDPDGNWSKKPPAAQGWYWYRKSESQHAVPTFVEDCGNSRFRAVEVYDQMMVWVNNVDVEWWQTPMSQPGG